MYIPLGEVNRLLRKGRVGGSNLGVGEPQRPNGHGRPNSDYRHYKRVKLGVGISDLDLGDLVWDRRY